MNTRDNQRGGIVIFAIIGVLLASLLAGGLYVTKQQAQIAEENRPPAVAIDTEKEANESEDVTPAPAKDEGAETTPAPATTQTPKPTPKPPASSQPSTRPTTPAPRVPVSGPSETLPSTGPSDVFASILVISAITFVAFIFVQSTNHLRRSALSR